MKKEKAIKNWQEKIGLYKSYIEFIKKIPTGKILGITYESWDYHSSIQYGTIGQHRCIPVRCLVEVLGFGKESIKVKVIAAESLVRPFCEFHGLTIHQGKKKPVEIVSLKLKYIQDFVIDAIPDDQLPVFINFPVKTKYFEERMKGK